MREYALDIADLGDLRKFQRRSPYNNEPPITVYLRKDVEAKALEIWGTWERLNGELQKRKEKEENYSESLLIVKKYNKDYRRLNTPEAKQREDTMRESGRVVLAAVAINGANFVLKLFGWLYTGSHSLFAEAIHSLADTCNQIILAFGIRKSLQVPNKEHPYGYHPMRYIAALISGVGIFCTGTGVSLYHGVHGLLHLTSEMAPDTSYYWAFLLLLGSLISEGGTLVIALQAASRAARQQNLPLKRYILRGDDPTLNVVILEDAAAVLGVLIAGSCMGLTSFYGMPVFDAVGSLAIGGLLGGVASFVIVSNAGALVGKSIAPASLATINRCLEADEMVRAIHDVKATNMGNEVIRYKAEVDFDGRKLTRNYLDSVDLVALQQELKEVAEAGENGNLESVEEFMLKHGENIVDLLGAEVDRIENELKRKHPQVRHVDLEVL
ncbi:PREDICTED: zinc transporter 9-like [Rhagoletis zephyria]|uniref:zinc transporter 9-like n=1 Tax=Rhagoletis zephyria TaxID=28612 RepID=UPI000811538F|nr:PREDICTED: zinc transporter 9-like [Rhagoletis zephyria]